MEAKIGLNPEEMISTFNRMYLDIWERNRDKINWEQKDTPRMVLDILEVVIAAARDGAIFTMYENNERIYSQLKEAGINLTKLE